MRAVRVHEKGGPEVLQLEDAPEPELQSGEVLIRVHAVGVNFADHLMRIGAYPAGDPPIIPGLEAAGTVERVAPDVEGMRPGQRFSSPASWAAESSPRPARTGSSSGRSSWEPRAPLTMQARM